MAEIWDLYDGLGNKVNQLHERGKPVPYGYFHMVVACFIFNEDHELLMQQRQSNKTWAEQWDICGATGSALAGEDMQTAIKREVKEEIGLDLDFANEHPIFTIYGDDYFTHYFIKRVETKNVTLTLQTSEVKAAKIVDKAAYQDMRKNGNCIPYFMFSEHVFDFMHIHGPLQTLSGAISQIQIEPLQRADLATCLSLFKETIRIVNSRDYNEKQIEAWINPNRTLASWEDSFSSHQGFKAVYRQQIIGFIDMDDNGYLDRLYVHAKYQNFGVAKQLVKAVEAYYRQKQIIEIHMRASITARPFFEHLGYQTVRKQIVVVNGIEMYNFVMKKQL